MERSISLYQKQYQLHYWQNILSEIISKKNELIKEKRLTHLDETHKG